MDTMDEVIRRMERNYQFKVTEEFAMTILGRRKMSVRGWLTWDDANQIDNAQRAAEPVGEKPSDDVLEKYTNTFKL